MATVWSKAWPIILAILFFGFIITIHELGHFTVARIFKVKINEFAIGMGPAIFKRKRKETQYSLRAFPIGGFVSMEGEDEESADERAFCKKAPWKRFLIVCAGAVINILLGTVLLSVVICQQNLVGTTTIHSFKEGSQLEADGLKPGDKIYKIRPTVIDGNCSLSGVENKCRKMLENGECAEDIANFCISYISASLEKMTDILIEKYGNLPLLYAGGVMSNSIIRDKFQKKYNAYFAEPEYSSDNAAGVAIMAYLKDKK